MEQRSWARADVELSKRSGAPLPLRDWVERGLGVASGSGEGAGRETREEGSRRVSFPSPLFSAAPSVPADAG